MNKPVSIKVPHVVEVVAIGDTVGLVLSPALLAKLGVAAGDKLDVVESESGFHLRPHDDGFGDQMEAAREVMARRRNALRELAK